MGKDTNTVYDWGQAAPSAPSIKRADPMGWIVGSVLLGAVFGLFVLAWLWRPLPWLPAPQGPLGEHLSHWAKGVVHMLAPGLFRADMKAYGVFWSALSDAQRLAIVWRAGLAALAACLPAIPLFKSCMTPRDSLIHLRGSVRLEGAAAVGQLVARFRDAAKRGPDHDIAPGVPYPSEMWTRHVFLIGGTGSGKSTALKPLIDKVVKAGERVILFDPKGEFTMGFHEPAIIAPWDKRSFAWDIAKDMRNIGDMRRFAAAMVQDSQDPMWANASRQLLVGLMVYLKSTRGNGWGWGELAEFMALPQASLLPIMQKFHPEAVRAVERASVTTQGILINLASFCSSIFDLAEAWGAAPMDRRVSFVEWTLGGSAQPQIILQGHGSYTELSKSYVRGIIEVVAAIVASVEMEDDPKRKLWIIADELPQMGKVPIRPLFEVGRSRGVRCVVACQDLAQLEEVYGERMVKAMVSMSGTLIIGQVMQGDSAEQVAKAMGTREVERANISSSHAGTGGSSNRSTTLSYARDELAIYKPSELASRLGPTADGKGVVMALVTGGKAYELFWPRHTMRRERLSHMPAAWTQGVGGGAPIIENKLSAQASDTESFFVERAGLAQAKGMAPAGSSNGQRISSPAGDPRGDAADATAVGGAKGDGAGSPVHRPVESSWPVARPAVASVEGIGAELIGQMLRESLEVVAAPVHQQPSASMPVGSREPILEAVAHALLEGMGAQPLALAGQAAQVAELALDARPGPKEEVRVAPRPAAPIVHEQASRVERAQGAKPMQK